MKSQTISKQIKTSIGQRKRSCGLLNFLSSSGLCWSNLPFKDASSASVNMIDCHQYRLARTAAGHGVSFSLFNYWLRSSEEELV